MRNNEDLREEAQRTAPILRHADGSERASPKPWRRTAKRGQRKIATKHPTGG